jgi:hypothetical protein
MNLFWLQEISSPFKISFNAVDDAKNNTAYCSKKNGLIKLKINKIFMI